MIELFLFIIVVFIIWSLMKSSFKAGAAEQSRLDYVDQTGDLTVLTEKEKTTLIFNIKKMLLQNGWQTDGTQWWIKSKPKSRMDFEMAVVLQKAANTTDNALATDYDTSFQDWLNTDQRNKK